MTWEDRFVKRTIEKAGYLATLYNRRNYRKHPERQRAITEASLDTLGLIGEIKIGYGEWGQKLFDGHLRVEIALAKDGAEAGLPVNWYALSEQETDQALLYHDTTTGMADIDFEAFNELVASVPDLELPEWGDFLTEFTAEWEQNGDGNNPPEEPPPMVDKAEELQAKWQVKSGDIWAIGDHRLICGDCREPETWERLLEGRKVNGVFTSPPYAEQRKKQYGGVPTDKYVEWWEAVQANVRQWLAEDGSFFVNIKPHCEDGQRVLYVFDLVLAMVREWGWRFVDELYWKRRAYPGGFKDRFRNEIESVYHFSDNNCKFRPDNVLVESSVSKGHSPARSDFSRWGTSLPQFDWGEEYARPTNVIDVSESERGISHEASFPLALPTFFIRAYSDPGDLWLDPFVGSGTTMIAAHNEGRIGYGIERLEKYCSVVLERFHTHTNTEPRRVSG